VSIRFGLAILFEIVRKGNEGLLLAGKQAAIGILDSWLIRSKVNAVQGKSGFQPNELGRGRWRILDRHLGGSLGVEAAGIAAGCSHRDRTWGSAGRIQSCGAAATGNAAGGCGPPADVNLGVVRTAAVATDGGGRASLDCRWVSRTRNGRRIPGRFLHGKGRRASGLAVSLHSGIGDASGGGITAAGRAIGVNSGGVVLAGDLAAGAAPGVVQSVSGIKVAAGGGRGRRLTGHNFTGIDGATGRDWRRFTLAPEHKHHATLQPYASDVGGGDGRVGTKVMIGECEICPDQAQGEVSTQVQVETAASQEAESVIPLKQIGRKPMPAQQNFQKG
jgi:hypothetical protein